MQFQVPQFIDVEDKIVGLTLKQFITLCLVGGFCFVLYFILNPWLWFILTIVIIGSAAALSIIKINGRPLFKLAMKALSFYWNPQTYVWLPEHPNLPKNEDSFKSATQSDISLEKIMSGISLKRAFQRVETGTKPSSVKPAIEIKRSKEQYQAYERLGGDIRVARRVDY